MELVSLFQNSQLHITFPAHVRKATMKASTQSTISASLLERVSDATGTVVTQRSVTITFIDDRRAVDNIVSACAVIASILGLSMNSTWTTVMDDKMITALKPYADFSRSKSFVPLEALDMKVSSRNSLE